MYSRSIWNMLNTMCGRRHKVTHRGTPHEFRLPSVGKPHERQSYKAGYPRRLKEVVRQARRISKAMTMRAIRPAVSGKMRSIAAHKDFRDPNCRRALGHS